MASEEQSRMAQSIRMHLAMETEDVLGRISMDEAPQAMGYFYRKLRQFFQQPEGLGHFDKPGIGTFCAQVPLELIEAAGARPVRLCMAAGIWDQAGGELLPAKSCSVVKAMAGMAASQLFFSGVCAVVAPTTCDGKKKCADLIETMGIAVHRLEMPPSKLSRAARNYWRESVETFMAQLQGWTKQKITRKSLHTAIHRRLKATEQFRRLCRLQTKGVLRAVDYFLVTQTGFFDDVEAWTLALSDLCAELEARVAEGRGIEKQNRPRMLLTGSPVLFPNIKVPLWIEQAGGPIVTDELCSAMDMFHDAPAYDETCLHDMVSALCDRYLSPCVCACLSPNPDRIRKMISLCRQARVDGVVYQTFSGCLSYAMERNAVAKALADEKLPLLYIETDAGFEDQGQLSTRIDAFIESVQAKRRNF